MALKLGKKGSEGIVWKLIGLILALMVLVVGAYLVVVLVKNSIGLLDGAPVTGCCSDCTSCPDESACQGCGTSCSWQDNTCKVKPIQALS